MCCLEWAATLLPVSLARPGNEGELPCPSSMDRTVRTQATQGAAGDLSGGTLFRRAACGRAVLSGDRLWPVATTRGRYRAVRGPLLGSRRR